MSWLDGIGDFISSNANWIKPVAAVGAGLFQNSSQGNSRNQLVDFYRQQEDADYQRQLTDRNNALAYMNAVRAAGGGGGGSRGGGGGGGNGAANARAQAAATLAAIKKQQDVIRPYYESETRLRPQRESVYSRGLGALDQTLTDKLPMLLRDFGSTVPAMSIKIPGL